MKKIKVIAPALIAIAACSSIVAGSTYALFTSDAKTNVAITSGKVDVTASIEGAIVKSIRKRMRPALMSTQTAFGAETPFSTKPRRPFPSRI